MNVAAARIYGSQSMAGPLKRVLMRRASSAMRGADARRWHYGPGFDAGRAGVQHETLARLVAASGADIEWLDVASPEEIDWRVDPARADGFYAEVRRYWPGLPDGALAPSYSGVRPKIHGPHEKAADFRIDGPAVHGVPGLVNLFGIESPGLTSAMAIAEDVVALTARA